MGVFSTRRRASAGARLECMSDLSRDARFWDRFARRYSAAKISDPEGYERSLARTIDYIRDLPSVLEIGCGTGSTALRLAPFVGHIQATDISANMIAIARQKAEAQQCGNVTFAVAAPQDILPSTHVFDAVLAFNMLHLVRDRAADLAQVHGLLKPGGLLISKTPCLSELNLFIRLAIPVMKLVGLAPHVSQLTGADIERDVAAAGFTIIEQARHGSGKRDMRLYLAARRN